MLTEQENVATTTIKTCQKIQDHLKTFFAMLKPIATSIYTKKAGVQTSNKQDEIGPSYQL